MNRSGFLRRVISGESHSKAAFVHANTLPALGVASGDIVQLSGPVYVGIQIESGAVEEAAIRLPRALAEGNDGKTVYLIADRPKEPGSSAQGSGGSNGLALNETRAADGLNFQVEKPNETFEDVAGMDEAKNRINDAIIDPFRYPHLYDFYGVEAGGGIILFGPPGCGKTFLATATAGEADAMFFNVKGSNI